MLPPGDANHTHCTAYHSHLTCRLPHIVCAELAQQQTAVADDELPHPDAVRSLPPYSNGGSEHAAAVRPTAPPPPGGARIEQPDPIGVENLNLTKTARARLADVPDDSDVEDGVLQERDANAADASGPGRAAPRKIENPSASLGVARSGREDAEAEAEEPAGASDADAPGAVPRRHGAQQPAGEWPRLSAYHQWYK